MSIEVQVHVRDAVIGDSTLKHVLKSLADHSDPRGRNAFPSVETISHETELDPRTVRRKLDKAEAEGWIEVQEPARQWRPTVYRLNVQKLQERRRTTPEQGGHGAPSDDRQTGHGAHSGRKSGRTPCPAREGTQSVREGTTPPEPSEPSEPSGNHPSAAGGASASASRVVSLMEKSFERFWRSYPRRVAKAAALKAWCRLDPDEALAEKIIRAVQNQKTWLAWTKDGGQYIPHPTTWLNQRRWEDEPPEVGRSMFSPKTAGNVATLDHAREYTVRVQGQLRNGNAP